MSTGNDDQMRLRRWRLVLGGEGMPGFPLDGQDTGRDGVMRALYGGGSGDDPSSERTAGLGGSAPRVARWLGDIRTYFPSSVVRVMQRDAIDRLGMSHLLLQPEMLAAVEPDMHLVTTLMALRGAVPEEARETARMVVRKVTDDLTKRLAAPMRQAVTGALDRASRTNRPRHSDIDWDRTIRANLRHYQPSLRTIVPDRLIGYGRRQTQVQREVVLCIDQSGSMASSVVYSSVFGAALASLRAVSTRLVVFDTSIVDLTDQIDDPVDVLFGVQLGGGTDIGGALGYCQSVITRPAQTILVLISDLIEGGVREQMLARIGAMVAAGVQVIALLALSDEGAPVFDADNAAALAGLGVPAFACTPDLFPELMASAIQRRDLGQWAAANDVVTAAPIL